MAERWLSVSEARRNLPLHIRDAALGKTRFITFRVNSWGKLRQYKAALIAYEDFQRLATPGPAIRPPAAELSAEYLHTVGNEDRIAAEHVQGIWPLTIHREEPVYNTPKARTSMRTTVANFCVN